MTLNLIVVFDKTHTKVLLCKRRKEPYLGLYNFVGGHVEDGEDGFSAAYRELYEETSITKADITLTHFMDLNYCLYDMVIEVYFGYLSEDIEVSGEENELLWLPKQQDYFDMTRFAGEGNMGHIMELIDQYERGVPVH